MSNYLKIFLISMIPLIELRGAVLYSQYLEMPIITSYIVCALGNIIPMPFVYFFARKILKWGEDKKIIGGACRFLYEKGERAGRKLTEKAGRRGTFLALLLFVGIPLPGTGAWTGTLGASILDIGIKHTFLAVTLGVLLAGAIMMTAGFLGFNLL
ncbi:MAG: small multi-drug export protein [Firmicutes bacterium]|nr:small multi-drug export protein [Bacillota bacterium]